MEICLRQIEETVIFREYTDNFNDRYDTRAHGEDPQYIYRGVSYCIINKFEKYNKFDYVTINGDISGYWRTVMKPTISKLFFFRINNNTSKCSCKGVCFHQCHLENIQFLLEKVNINETKIALRILEFLI